LYGACACDISIHPSLSPDSPAASERSAGLFGGETSTPVNLGYWLATGSAPADLTVTGLARALPHGWAAQENKFGIA
jgi:hypothetical protein